MKKTILGLVIVASIFMAGCPVSDLHPLYNDSDNVAEPLLVGKWLPPDANDKGFIAFEKASGTGYTMILDDQDSGFTDRYDCRLVRLGGNLFADLHFSSRIAWRLECRYAHLRDFHAHGNQVDRNER